MGNGTALEAVFSSETKPKNFVVVLNDNGMSISKNQSALYRSLSKMTAKKRYRKVNSFLGRTFKETGAFGRKLRKFKYFLKGWLNKNDFFERCGFKYIGPVDGHDLRELLAVLSNIRKMDEPVFLHAVTCKGKGYAPAEEDPSRFHGTGKNFAAGENSFSTALGRLLCERAEQNKDLVAVTAAMKDGVGLSEFSQKFPDRCFDVGICEEYAVTMAAGMAKGGLLPVVCVYSTFLQRAFDQIAHDVCLQNLPVIFCIDRAGFVGADGKTHQGLLDEAFLRAVPNLRIFAPKDCAELADVFDFALSVGGPCAIRYPNGYAPNLGGTQKISEYYQWETLSDGDGVVVLACGARAVARALDAKRLSGTNCMVVNCRTVKPPDERLLREVSHRKIIAFEEGYLAGGFGSAVAEFYASCGPARQAQDHRRDTYIYCTPTPHSRRRNAASPRRTSPARSRPFPHSKIFEKSQTEELMEEKRPSEKAGDVPQKTEQTPLSQLRWKDRAEAAKGGLLGFFIGLAVIVPGVSGSTVAILFRLYEKLLCALGNLLRAFKRCAAFLLPVAVGVVLGFALGFFAVRGLLQISPFAVIALFAGLMAGAYPAVTDQLKGERLTLPRAALFAAGVLLPVGMCFLSLISTGDRALEEVGGAQYLLFVLLGALVAVTQVVPGLSATALLMLAGYFNPLMQSVSLSYWSENPLVFAVYACLLVGFAAGLLGASKGLSVLLERKKAPTFYAVAGLALGSLLTMFFNPEVLEVYRGWAEGELFAPHLIAGVLLFFAGACLSYAFVRRGRRQSAGKN